MRYLASLMTALLFTAPVRGADVDLRAVDWQTNEGGRMVTVYLHEDIDIGDLERVRAAMVEARTGDKLVVALQLDSYGGDGNSGLELAEWVAANNINVLLAGRCWSACSFAALAALGRGNLLLRPGAELGVHQVYDDGAPDRPNLPWTERAAVQLSRHGAPRTVLDAMLVTPPTGMATYGYSELVGMGALVLEGNWWFWE
jgi:hypothetical protein